MAMKFPAAAVVLTTGTFLRGLIHIGEVKIPAGRMAAHTRCDRPIRLPSVFRRRFMVLVCGWAGSRPARRRGWTAGPSIGRALEMQHGDDPPVPFSFLTQTITTPQIACDITRTTLATHAIIRANLHRAPMYSGQIDSTGPRYCPSIEDKVIRFADRDSHQIFLEPEGLNDDTIYPNGISTSLPEDVQLALARHHPGAGKGRGPPPRLCHRI